MSKTPFDPKANLPYPEKTDGHYRPTDPKVRDIVFDKDYPYVDTSKAFMKKRRQARFLLRLLVFPFSYLRLGLRVKGKKNLRKHKKLLKQGALSVSNHVNVWDYIAIMNGIKPFKPYVLVLKGNVEAGSGDMVRQVGGIPIPEGDFAATKAYLKAIEGLLENGGWLHIYPEGSMWEFYRPIRPFKKGVASLARLTHKPVVPLAFSYRRPGWIRKKMFGQRAKLTLHIGEPLVVDENLPSIQAQEIDLLTRLHKAVANLAGLSEKEDIYEPLYQDSKRIDY